MEDLLTPADLATYLGLSPKTLSNWRSMRIGPQPLPVGGVIRYRKREVQAWLEEQAETVQNWMAS